MVSKGVNTIALLVVTLCLHSSLVGANFAWQDCGVQFTKNIHYVSASISPTAVGTSGPLSINVQASITSKIYNADTQLIIYKDGELYLDVKIQDLCTIISTTKSLSCPLSVGPVSFTYTFQSLPVLPVGHYVFQIKNSDQGCLQLSGNAGSLIGTSNYQTSAFSVSIHGVPTFETNAAEDRAVGDYIVVSSGSFRSQLVATTDLGGLVDLYAYGWQLSGEATNVTTSGRTVIVGYQGDWSVYSSAETLLEGYFNLTYTYDQTTDTLNDVVGTFTPNPVYYFSPNFTYPIVFGNLAPFQVAQSAENIFLVTGSKKWCTAGVDSCGVCGGDGSTCAALGAVQATKKLSDRELSAVLVGSIGGVVGIIVVAFLAVKLKRARRAPRYNDADLIDHPQKPDYGTMAIDDIMSEGGAY